VVAYVDVDIDSASVDTCVTDLVEPVMQQVRGFYGSGSPGKPRVLRVEVDF
jgi:hypothetical protein